MAGTRAFVDWVGCTFKRLDNQIGIACAQVSEIVPTLGTKWGFAVPTSGYKHAARTSLGALVSVGREDMGVHLELPGACLAAIAPDDLAIERVLRWLTESSAQYSRADFAIDAVDTGLNIWRLRALFEDGHCDTKIRSFRMIESEKGGLTLYLGSPTSFRRVRIYNKAAERRRVGELPDTDDWIRIEYQARDEAAHTAVLMLTSAEDVSGAIRSIILSVVDFPLSHTWTDIMKGASTTFGASHKHRGNRRKWLLTACAGSLAKELDLDPNFKLDFERAVQSATELLHTGASSELDRP